MNDSTSKTNEENAPSYQTLDKDYGRTKMVGSGYGDIDSEQYKLLETLVNDAN